MKLFLVALVSVIALIVAGTAATLPSAAANGLSVSDRTFVDRALRLNTETMARAQVVESSADNYVLDYAEEIVGDRQAANGQLAAIAQQAGYRSASPVSPRLGSSPTIRPSGATNEANERKLQGAFSPIAYFTGEVRANKEAVALYQDELSHASNTALRRYASAFLPKMQGELTRATHLLHVEMALHPAHR